MEACSKNATTFTVESVWHAATSFTAKAAEKAG